MTMTPGRRLVYNFMNLPHHKQLEILLHLELTTQMEIAATHGHEAEITLFTEGFKRAKEQSKLEPLTKAIESAVFEQEQHNAIYNPYKPKPVAPPKAKFTVTPHNSYDKRIEVSGPDGLRFFIDNDDVNQKVVAGQLTYLLALLEKQWDYTPPDSDYESEEDED